MASTPKALTTEPSYAPSRASFAIYSETPVRYVARVNGWVVTVVTQFSLGVDCVYNTGDGTMGIGISGLSQRNRVSPLVEWSNYCVDPDSLVSDKCREANVPVYVPTDDDFTYLSFPAIDKGFIARYSRFTQLPPNAAIVFTPEEIRLAEKKMTIGIRLYESGPFYTELLNMVIAYIGADNAAKRNQAKLTGPTGVNIWTS